MSNKGRLTLIIVFGLLVYLLTGCPRVAHIEIYNNTSETLTINSSGLHSRVEPGALERFRYTGSSLQISSSLGSWDYLRNIPHGGNDGPFFDGTLRLQVNSSGLVHALRADDVPPVSGLLEQPTGFPLHPQ